MLILALANLFIILDVLMLNLDNLDFIANYFVVFKCSMSLFYAMIHFLSIS